MKGVRESTQYRVRATLDRKKPTFEVNKVNNHAFWRIVIQEIRGSLQSNSQALQDYLDCCRRVDFTYQPEEVG